jgi:hypothetical protein
LSTQTQRDGDSGRLLPHRRVFGAAFLAGTLGLLLDLAAGQPIHPLVVSMGLFIWILNLPNLRSEPGCPPLTRSELLLRLAPLVFVTAFLWLLSRPHA